MGCDRMKGTIAVIANGDTPRHPEVLAAYEARGFKELSRKTIGEWTTGLLTRQV